MLSQELALYLDHQQKMNQPHPLGSTKDVSLTLECSAFGDVTNTHRVEQLLSTTAFWPQTKIECVMTEQSVDIDNGG